MKRLLAMFLAVLMVVCLTACGGGGESTPTNPPATEAPATEAPATEAPATEAPATEEPAAPTEEPEAAPTEEPAAPTVAEPEEIPYEPLYANSFETADNLTSVHQVAATEDPTLTGATYALVPSAHEVMISDGYGVVGNSLILDGKYGVSIPDFPKTADDSYTIAFWYAADRYSEFGPLVQMGRNVGMNDQENEVAWINFTKVNAWSIEGGECAPVAWNRNSKPTDSADVWPWIGNNVTLLGKKEWVHVALVVTGEAYKDNDAVKGPCSHVSAIMYVNGIPVMDANPSVIGTTDEAGNDTSANWMGVAAEIFDRDGVKGIECLLGVNYWDQYSKEYLDEFYFYDEALTAGQVATLYTKGTAPEYETQPKYEGPTDDAEAVATPAPVTLPEITPDASAIDTLGVVTRDGGFWTDTSDGFELKDGGTLTIKFNNYSNVIDQWDSTTFAFTNTAVTTDKIASADNYEGYAEYACARIDGIEGAYWSMVEGTTGTYEKSWTDQAAFQAVAVDADVTAVFNRAGNVITVNVTLVGADGTQLTETITITSADMTAESPCYVHLTNEKCYTEILSVE